MRFNYFLKFIHNLQKMFNGDFIVKQSKFLLFITLLYLKDCNNVNNNPIFDFDFDLISDVLSLAEDLIDLSKSYGDYEMSKYFLPQYKWVTRNKDIHLNYSQLIKKYGLTEEEQSDENDGSGTIALSNILYYDSANDFVNNIFVESTGMYWIVRDVEDRVFYRLASNTYQDLGGPGLSDGENIIHLSLSNSDFLNFRRDKYGELDLTDFFAIVYHFTKIGSIYISYFCDTDYFFVINRRNSMYNNKVFLTVTLSLIVWTLRLISAIVKLFDKLYNNMFFLFPILCCDVTFKLIYKNRLVYIIGNVLYNNIPLAIVVFVNLIFYLNRMEMKRPLALSGSRRKFEEVNSFLHAGALQNKFLENFCMHMTNEERRLVLYDREGYKTPIQNRLSIVLLDCHCDNNLYSKLLQSIYFYWARLTQCQVWLRLHHYKKYCFTKFQSHWQKPYKFYY